VRSLGGHASSIIECISGGKELNREKDMINSDNTVDLIEFKVGFNMLDAVAVR
jgi:hypothetical protein